MEPVAVATLQVLETVPEFVTSTPLGKLLAALVVLALVLVVGRLVLGLAWKLLRIAILVVAVLWLLSVVIPAVGL